MKCDSAQVIHAATYFGLRPIWMIYLLVDSVWYYSKNEYLYIYLLTSFTNVPIICDLWGCKAHLVIKRNDQEFINNPIPNQYTEVHTVLPDWDWTRAFLLSKWALLKLAWGILNMLSCLISILLSISIDLVFPKRYVTSS